MPKSQRPLAALLAMLSLGMWIGPVKSVGLFMQVPMTDCAVLPALALCVAPVPTSILQRKNLGKQMQCPAVGFALGRVFPWQGESVDSYRLTQFRMTQVLSGARMATAVDVCCATAVRSVWS